MCDKPGCVVDSSESSESDEEQKQTDNKCLVMLNPDHRVPESQITDGMISTLTVACSACGHQINHHKRNKVYMHKDLNAIVCKKCYSYYGDGKFDKDGTGSDEYCTWCAEGGKLLVCDQCGRAFCKECIRRNLSRREISRIMTLDVWLCYVCDPKQIAELVRYAKIIQEYSKKAELGHRASCPQVLDVSVEDEENVEETLCDIAQKLRLMADIMESDLKKNSKTVMKRASSLLREHLKSVSRVAKEVDTITKQREHSKAHRGKETVKKLGRPGAGSADGEPDLSAGPHVLDSDTNSPVSGSVRPDHTYQKHLLASNKQKPPVLPQTLEHDGPHNAFNGEKENEREEVSDKDADNNAEMGEEKREVREKKESEGVETKEQTATTSDLEKNVAVCNEDKDLPKDQDEDNEQGPVRSGEETLEAQDPAGCGTEEFSLTVDCPKDEEGTCNTMVPESQEPSADDVANSKIEDPSPSLLCDLQDSQLSDIAAAHAPPEKDSAATVEENVEPERAQRAQSHDCEQEGRKTEIRGEDANKNAHAEDSSSLSDNEGGAGVAETESLKGNSESDSPKSTRDTPVKRSTRKRAPLSENEKARRALQRSLRKFSSDSSSDDDAQDSKLKLSPRICKTTLPKRGRRPPLMESTPKKTTAKSSSDQERAVHSNESSEDPKLKMKPVVLLDMLNLNLGNTGYPDAIKRKNSEDEIASLLRMPGKVKTNLRGLDDAGSEQEKKPAAKRAKKEKLKEKAVLDASESGSSVESSDNDEEQKSVAHDSKETRKSNNELSKEALLQSILQSSSESISEDEDAAPATKKASKKTKCAPENGTESGEEMREIKEDNSTREGSQRGGSDDDDDDDDDDVLDDDGEVIKKKSKKWKKYEKLLKKKTAVGSSDEDGIKRTKASEEHSNSKKKASPKKRKLKFSDEEDSASGVAKKAESSEESSDDSSIFSSSSDSLLDFRAPKKKGTRKGRGKRKNEKRSTSDSESEKPKKKRKRIKVAASSSGNDDDDDDVEILNVSQNSDTKGRKNIRKLLTDGELTKQTKIAAQAEEERKKRIRERQKLYNDVMGSAPDKGDTVVNELILEIDSKTKTPIVSVNPLLVKCMKPHQTKGVKFMYDCTIETVEMLAKDKKGAGAILAHCMGLGKTFQVISFLHTVLTNEKTKKHLSTALVVCPYNTILNWVEEFERWLEDRGIEIPVREISSIKDNYMRVDVLDDWQDEGGVLVLGYDMFRLLVNGRGRRFPAKLRDRIERALLDPGPDIAVCDEGHVLKNDSSNLSKAMCRMRTNRRIVLTGTPLQNNLQEYHCMVNFVKPNLLGTKKEFLNRFVNPIKNGQCADSTSMDVKLMKKRVHILHSLLDGCVQRCDYGALARFLPPKHEYVISVKLSEQQVALYRHYLDNFARNKQTRTLGAGMLCDYNALRNVWTHPYLLEVSAARAALKEMNNEDDEEDDDFINDDSSADEADAKDDEIVCLDDPQPSSSKKDDKKSGDESSGDEIVKSWHTRSRGTVGEDAEARDLKQEQERREKEKQWWSQYVPEEDMERYEISGKMLLLCHILQECEAIGDKVLLFSQSLTTLDMVEQMLRQFEERAEAAAADPTAIISVNDALRDCQNTWTLGVDYFRMDGSTAADLRKRWIEMFNCEDDQRARLFLISTRAGSLGTNLVGANRVILMDASWNPTHDVQSIFRVYRFGQKKPVFIYRLLAHGTMEEKIYDRQVTKQSLSCRVIDEQQIERHFNAADLQELYTFDPESKSNRPTPMVPKDRLLAELLIRGKEWIVSYHEHDSLLQNITEEDLTEEERKTAWEEYNAEREGRIKMNMENATMNQQAPQNAGGGPRPLTLDLNKIIRDIRQKNPNITSDQLALSLRNALGAYRQQFRKQQMDAFNQRTAYQKAKQPVPQEVNDRLGQASMAIQQLNNLLMQLEQSINNARVGAATYHPSARMPNANFGGQQYAPRYTAAQQFARMQQSAWVRANARYAQQCNSAFRPSATAPIVCEADDGTPNLQRPAQRPSTSSVTITEIID
ncbi:transcriptional regulator ATRX homolog isoform X2 [Ornithodoros turicata]